MLEQLIRSFPSSEWKKETIRVLLTIEDRSKAIEYLKNDRLLLITSGTGPCYVDLIAIEFGFTSFENMEQNQESIDLLEIVKYTYRSFNTKQKTEILHFLGTENLNKIKLSIVIAAGGSLDHIVPMKMNHLNVYTDALICRESLETKRHLGIMINDSKMTNLANLEEVLDTVSKELAEDPVPEAITKFHKVNL